MDQKSIIIKTLNSLGANRLSSGYNYIIYGLLLLLEHDQRTLNLIKSLYIDIAEYYNTTWNCVEKNIRHVIKSIWMSDNDKIIKSIFGSSSSERRPTNKEFFQKMHDYIKQYNTYHTRQDELIILCPVSHQYCKSFTDYCLNAIRSSDGFHV